MKPRHRRATRKRSQRKRKTVRRQRGGGVIDCSTITPQRFEVKAPARYGSYPGSVAYAGLPEVIALVEKHKSALERGVNDAFIAEYNALQPSLWASEVKDTGDGLRVPNRKLESFKVPPSWVGDQYAVRTISDTLRELREALFNACQSVAKKKEGEAAIASEKAREDRKIEEGVRYIESLPAEDQRRFIAGINPKGSPIFNALGYNRAGRIPLINKIRNIVKARKAEEEHRKATNLLGLYDPLPEKNLLEFPSRAEELSGLFGPAVAPTGGAGTAGGAGVSS